MLVVEFPNNREVRQYCGPELLQKVYLVEAEIAKEISVKVCFNNMKISLKNPEQNSVNRW